MSIKTKKVEGSQGTSDQRKEQAIIKLLLKDQAIVRENSSKPTKEGQILLEFNGEALIRKNTITLIKGKTGVHKSRVAQELCSMLITNDAERRVALGFRVRGNEPTNVIYVDTERNQTEHFPQAIQTIRMHAGYEQYEDIQQLNFFSFLGLQRPERLDAIRLVLKSARAVSKAKGHIVVVLDVVSDCIVDFNDLRESFLLADEFAQCMKDHDVSFIAVIHENPDAVRSTKARGHLGTETGNKASAVIQIARCNGEKDMFVINVEKSRSSRIPQPVHIYYNDLLERLLSCEAPVLKQDKTITLLLDYLANITGDEISKEDLEKGTGIKRSTLDRKLKEIVESHLSIEINGDDFLIVAGKTGKKAVVKLRPLALVQSVEEHL